MDISNGLILMILGMGGVFSILFIMFILMKVFISIDSKIRVKQPAILPTKENMLKKVAISAALHHHKKKLKNKQ